MVPFGGWDMPVQYPDGIVKSHLHTRSKAGLFDVSHMGQIKIHGRNRADFIHRLTVVDMTSLRPYHGCYSLIPNEQGGIIDDTIITNCDDFIYVVLNAGCYQKDMVHIRQIEHEFKTAGKDVNVEAWTDRALISLQGPSAETVLQNYVGGNLSQIKFFQGGFFTVDNFSCYIQRSGYTGEDGFEISIPAENVVDLVRRLLKEEEVLPIGLGARDSLRLEAGLPLYGHELDVTTTIKEAGLTWTISKRRQAEGGFIGSEITLAELPKKIGTLARRRVGLIVEGPPAREGATIHNSEGQQIGIVTSGTLSPTLKQSIAMAYVKPPHHVIGTDVNVNIRGTLRKAVISPIPFVPTRYKTTKE
eukprot:TRINITY_DN16_c0_g2_i2.p1 TRINITY_DN16_c0_g2~~TRINITY_DN16_c0_g2_i2.p1  ORF type:complete len:359 (-),score=49.43 TRINITY_DN16_c0_g2_i2:64-1140(-)